MQKTVIEYTCDVCGSEVDKSILTPNKIKLKGFTDTFTTIEFDIDTNNADVCIYCFIKAVNKLSPMYEPATTC